MVAYIASYAATTRGAWNADPNAMRNAPMYRCRCAAILLPRIFHGKLDGRIAGAHSLGLMNGRFLRLVQIVIAIAIDAELKRAARGQPNCFQNKSLPQIL